MGWSAPWMTALLWPQGPIAQMHLRRCSLIVFVRRGYATSASFSLAPLPVIIPQGGFAIVIVATAALMHPVRMHPLCIRWSVRQSHLQLGFRPWP